MSPTFRSLSNANYRLYAAGGVVSNTGTWMQRVAQDWLVLQLTGNSGTAIGITTGLQFLPFLVLAPVAGLVADRMATAVIDGLISLGRATATVEHSDDLSAEVILAQVRSIIADLLALCGVDPLEATDMIPLR